MSRLYREGASWVASLTAAQVFIAEFVDYYNHDHRHTGIGLHPQPTSTTASHRPPHNDDPKRWPQPARSTSPHLPGETQIALTCTNDPIVTRLHWSRETEESRSEIAVAIAGFALDAVVVVGVPMAKKKQERARRICLEELLPILEQQHQVSQVVLEARTQTLVTKDLRHIPTLVGKQLISPNMRIQIGLPSEEPMRWLPGAVAGAVNAARAGRADWYETFRHTVTEIETVIRWRESRVPSLAGVPASLPSTRRRRASRQVCQTNSATNRRTNSATNSTTNRARPHRVVVAVRGAQQKACLDRANGCRQLLIRVQVW